MSQRFPAEAPGPSNWLRRAATSVPLNIAEGGGCDSSTEFSRFLGYAYRSLKEVVTAVELCQRLYPSLNPDQAASLVDEGNEISRMTYSLIRKLTPGDERRW